MSQFLLSARISLSEHPLAELISQHLWIAQRQARYLHRTSMHAVELEELTQAGYFEICLLATKYRPNKGCTFFSFAWHRVKRPMRALIRQEITARKLAVALKGSESACVTLEPLDWISHRRLLQNFQTLPLKERKILESLYLSETQHNINSLSQDLGLSKATIYRKRQAAIRHLRNTVA